MLPVRRPYPRCSPGSLASCPSVISCTSRSGDGFRALVFRERGDVDIRSRNDRPLARYFPELVEALLALPVEELVLDGEIVVVRPDGFDFPAIMSRLHPAASRVERLRRETPAWFVAFDLLAEGDASLLGEPFAARRERLERLVGEARPPLVLTPATGDVATAAAWLARFTGDGVDGVVAKERAGPYVLGKRAMVKVKTERTADCVVAGFRWMHERELVGSLVLGLWDGEVLRHVGVATSFAREEREALVERLRPLMAPLEGHPWEQGFGLGRSPLGRLLGAAGRWDPREMALDWVPLRPELVCEVAYDQVDAKRFRHPARFRRWRPNRDARSCSIEQLDVETVAPRDLLLAS